MSDQRNDQAAKHEKLTLEPDTFPLVPSTSAQAAKRTTGTSAAPSVMRARVEQLEAHIQRLVLELVETRKLLRDRTAQAERLSADLVARTADLVAERELVKERTEQAEQLVRLIQKRAPRLNQPGNEGCDITIEGVIATDVSLVSNYSEAVFITTNVRSMWPQDLTNVGTLFAFRATNILISSGYCPIDVDRKHLISNHTYSDIGKSIPIRYNIFREKFRIESTSYRTITDRAVVIGGPIDGNWYHWLYSWCARLFALQLLKPEIFSDEAVKFILHPAALKGSFGAILETFSISSSRIISADDSEDLLVLDAELVSFPDQSKLYPNLIYGLRDQIIDRLSIKTDTLPKRRLFLSRQFVENGRRRVHNFEPLSQLLDQFDFDILDLATMTVLEQAQAFADAEIVMGGHGSDFADMMFCRAGTPIIVFESEDSVVGGRDRGLRILADVLGLTYFLHKAKVFYDPEVDYRQPHQRTNQDYIIDVDGLERVLKRIIDPRQREHVPDLATPMTLDFRTKIDKWIARHRRKFIAALRR